MQQSNGLRFDVYERVHLPGDAADVHELEEIELTPYIQVVNQGEQVLLRGNLLLAGVYVSQGETRMTQTLEHWIPVEITLPANRVSSVEALSVEVDNFDVDLLSARTLNITGVLSLRGVESRESRESSTPAYAWGEEPFTVVHQRDRSASADEQADEAGIELAPSDVRAAEPNEPADDEDGEAPAESALRSDAEQDSDVSSSEPVKWSGFAMLAGEAREEAAREGDVNAADSAAAEVPAAARLTDLEEPEEAEQPSGAARESADPALVEQAEQEAPAQAQAAEAADAVVQDAAEEPAVVAADAQPVEEEAPVKPELKVAVGAKRLPEAPKAKAQGLSQLLFTHRSELETRWNPDARAAKQPAEPEGETHTAAPGEDVEWKRLFLRDNPDEQFRKVRMCIVQKDETLDAIAGRYQLNPREIVLYNRLADQAVSEGQVLMIP